jgi:hypothetical protein
MCYNIFRGVNMGKITAILTSLRALLTSVPIPLAAQESLPYFKYYKHSYKLVYVQLTSLTTYAVFCTQMIRREDDKKFL